MLIFLCLVTVQEGLQFPLLLLELLLQQDEVLFVVDQQVHLVLLLNGLFEPFLHGLEVQLVFLLQF